MIIKFFKALYFSNKFYLAFASLIFLFTLGYFLPLVFAISRALLLLFMALLIVDLLLIFLGSKNSIEAQRILPERFSNGDKNKVIIKVKNNFNFPVTLELIDEIPFQFQKRNFLYTVILNKNTQKNFSYFLRPVERGEYSFGKLNIYAKGRIGLISKRFSFEDGKIIPVYPSFIQMRKYELMAISNRLTEVGIKKIRRISMNNEFDQIKEYVQGDDYRTINWKATARKSQLMVNQYQDEKSQHVISIIDKGRTMQMPFEGMSLLDYAINSSLVISNIATHKQDKAGLITFSDKIDSVLLPGKKNNQLLMILEMLYKQSTNFREPNFELLYTTVHRVLKQRSLLLVYTNFEGLSSLKRQIKYLKQLAIKHLVVVIFFQNTEVNKVLHDEAKTIEDVYIKTIAGKFIYEKKLIVKELQKNGIHSILTKPQNLTVDTINKYLELKSRGFI